MDAIKKKRGLKSKLALASLSLVGVATGVSAGEFEGLEVDTSILFYQESDNRVTAFEPVLNIQKEFSGDRFANVKLVIDALTGATPNGATPSNTPQTFTRPSGNGTYTVVAGETPLDDTFLDTRVALSGSWTQPLDRLSKATVGLNLSVEFDFRSIGLNTSVSRDFNQRNTTLTFGLAGEFDTIEPEGGIPNALDQMVMLNQLPAREADDTRTIIDVIFGLTQVVNRKTLMQFNYSFSQSSGYHTDPFKLISRIDETLADTDPNFLTYLYENRPDSRMRHSLYWLTRYHLTRDVLGVSYRLYTDDWGILSHTLDLTYRLKFKEKHFLEPHIRYYQQTEADFYRVGVSTNAPLPAEVSADYRLAAFTGITVGFSYGWDFRDESSLLVRLEYYMQDGDASHDTAIGFQKNQDLFPDMQATIIQIQYSF
ncbi:FIG01057804: hypothetical protein [hydrothermal vent metagenome]|uniref:DUF3570 domain-containing protein n=1 Tax=hydrothermal vent metagenome TaxID=652676 RepID=A0A3B1CQY7_9ZZZZ